NWTLRLVEFSGRRRRGAPAGRSIQIHDRLSRRRDCRRAHRREGFSRVGAGENAVTPGTKRQAANHRANLRGVERTANTCMTAAIRRASLVRAPGYKKIHREKVIGQVLHTRTSRVYTTSG